MWCLVLSIEKWMQLDREKKCKYWMQSKVRHWWYLTMSKKLKERNKLLMNSKDN